MRGKDIDTYRRMVVHALYVCKQQRFQEKEVYLTIRNRHEEVVKMEVDGSTTLGVCVAQFWSSLGKALVGVEVLFHGISLSHKEVVLHPGEFVCLLCFVVCFVVCFVFVAIKKGNYVIRFQVT